MLPQRLPTSAFLTCKLIVFIISCYECMIPKSFSLPLKQKNTDNISLNRDERDAARLSRCCAVLAIWTLVPPWRSINADLPSHHHHSRHHKKPSAGTVTITQGGITCGAIDEPRKSSKAIDERVIINIYDKNVVIAHFRDKNVYR